MVINYLYLIFLVIGVTFSLYLVSRLWKIRNTSGAYALIGAILCVAVWSFGSIFEVALKSYTLKLLSAKVEYLGISFLGITIFSFAANYSGRSKWLTRSRHILLFIIPVITFLLAITNDWHHLLWSFVMMPAGSLFGPILVGHGPWYFINVVYQYGLLLVSTFFFLQIVVTSHKLYRTQAIVMLIGMAISWAGNLLYMLQLGPFPGLDWTPLTFTITIFAFEIGFARFGLLDVLPVAQSSVFNNMRDGVLVADINGRVVEINPSATNIFHKEADQIIGKGVEQLIPDWVSWKEETSTAFEYGHEILIREEFQERTYNLRIAPILDKRGRITGHMAILTDITEQKLAQAQMYLQASALEAARNGIVITDTKGNILWANSTFSQLTGYSREEAIGKNPRLLKSNKQTDEYYHEMWQTISSGNVWHGELVNRRKDGSEYYEEMTITPLIQPDGKITNFIAIKQDISSRKKSEEELRLAHKEAVEVNRMKTQLLANVSHDLRTPLGAIMGYTEMLETGIFGNLNTEQKEAASEILDSTNQLLAFVNNLIGQAQIETGRLIVRPVPFNPDELVDGIRSIVGFAIKKKGLNFEVEIAPDLPKQICGDAYWIKQILLNLLNNAAKFTEEGTVKVRLFLVDQGSWAIQVLDTGSGIPPEARKLIFEPFHQVEENSRSGSGLGLSIVNQLVALMQGKIELSSEIGKGSTFTIILPLMIS